MVLATTTIFCNFTVFASEHINKITIEGNRRIESSTISNYLGFKIGDEYSLQKQNESLKNLYHTSLFNNIDIKFINGNLVIKVIEAPLVIGIDFKGNSKIKNSILSKELLTASGESLSKANIQIDAKKIQEIYKRSGRFSVLVLPIVKQLQNDRVKVVFEITEGPKTSVKRIYFVGNENYRDNELKNIILTKEARWFSFLETNDTYDPDRIDYDKELLKEFYQSIGFIDFRVISAIAELSSTKESFAITYSVEEGQKYKFGAVNIDNKISLIDNELIQKFISVKYGQTFNMKSLETIAEKITETLANSGYPQVNVEPVISKKDANNKIADVTFLIEKADKVFINSINIDGNLKTEDRVIRREFRIAEGDLFNRTYIARGEQNLRNLDYFEKVSTVITPTDQRDKYDIDVEVQEKSTSSINFDIGYGTAGGLFGSVSFAERNLIGTGRYLSAGVRAGKKNSNYYLGITEPRFLDKDLSLGFNVFSTYSGRSGGWGEEEQNYVQKSLGLTNSLGYEIYEDLDHRVEYTIKKDELKNPTPSSSRYMIEQMGRFITSSVGQTITYNQIDSRVVPKNGYLLSGTQEYAGLGGDNKYIKHELDAKYFKSFINNKLTLKLSGNTGNITGLKGKTVRISDRFNLGDYSLRGFASGGVGPRDKRTEEGLGGQNFYTFSTELNFPLGLPEDFGITGATFVDIGSTWGLKLNSNSKYSKDDFYDDKFMRASLGVGIIWVTRFAPIRVDWALPIKKKKYDDTQRLHLKFSTHL
ncbi:MAG: outer membrane protein assembly factor BamA [Rickettsiaceae bacterium]|nr:MAG: outer membrane protein assembly factor BamA [Rickettsiaceae bacterium]